MPPNLEVRHTFVLLLAMLLLTPLLAVAVRWFLLPRWVGTKVRSSGVIVVSWLSDMATYFGTFVLGRRYFIGAAPVKGCLTILGVNLLLTLPLLKNSSGMSWRNPTLWKAAFASAALLPIVLVVMNALLRFR